MRAALLLFILTVLLLAGCASQDPAPAAPSVVPDPAAASPEAIAVYHHDALVVGAGVTTPFGTGVPAPWPFPPAKVEGFTLAEPAAVLEAFARVCSGTGLAGFEVLAPDGSVAWASEIKKRADTPGVGCVDLPRHQSAEGPFAVGTYEVRIYTAGAMQPQLDLAAVPVA